MNNTRLQSHNDELTESITEARKELVNIARVPSASLGRMKDIFDLLCTNMTKQATELLTEELHERRTAALQAMEGQRKELEQSFHKLLTNTVENLTNNRDWKVAAAKTKQVELQKLYDALVHRTSSSERLLQEAEAKVTSSQLETAKALAQVEKVEAADRRTKETWAEALTKVVDESTLKARKEENVADSSKPWRHRQRTANEQLRQDVDRHSSPGEQLKCVVKAYEQAKDEEEERTREAESAAAHHLAAVQEAASKAAAQLEEAIARERAELRGGFEESEVARKGLEAKVAKMTWDLGNANAVAREEARTDIKELEQDYEAMKLSLVDARSEVEAKQKEVLHLREDLRVCRDQFRIESAGLTMLLQKEKYLHQVTAADLRDARAAMPRSGGYYFAAAPAQPVSPPRRSSNHGSGSLPTSPNLADAEHRELLGGSTPSSPGGSPPSRALQHHRSGFLHAASPSQDDTESRRQSFSTAEGERAGKRAVQRPDSKRSLKLGTATSPEQRGGKDALLSSGQGSERKRRGGGGDARSGRVVDREARKANQ